MTKVTITHEGKSKINALFNPTQYSVNKSNSIAETAIPGLEAPILHYVHGNVRTLDMDLFFDTYEKGTNVSDETNKIYDLLNIIPSTHAPPICKIEWGGFEFQGVLEHANGKFTLFLADGTPVRATLSVSFKEYLAIDVLVRERPRESADHRKTRVVRSGDRIDNIADEEYGDPENWRPIADANDLDDPSRLEPGFILLIPSLD
jgi:hypothetical protein